MSKDKVNEELKNVILDLKKGIDTKKEISDDLIKSIGILTDRVNERDKLELERDKLELEKQKLELEKCKELREVNNSTKDYKMRNKEFWQKLGLSAGEIIIKTGVTIFGVVTIITFEEKGCITSRLGNSVINWITKR